MFQNFANLWEAPEPEEGFLVFRLRTEADQERIASKDLPRQDSFLRQLGVVAPKKARRCVCLLDCCAVGEQQDATEGGRRQGLTAGDRRASGFALALRLR